MRDDPIPAYPKQPGNPALTEALRGAGPEAVAAYCDRVREREGLPDGVLEHLLDDMAIATGKVLRYSGSTREKMGLNSETRETET